MNVCVDASLPLPPKLAEPSLCPPPPLYYLFKGSGTGAKLLDWNLFTASSCQLMEGLETVLNVLVLMIQVLNFAPQRLLFPVLFNGSGTSLAPTPSLPLTSSHLIAVSPASARLPGRGCETTRWIDGDMTARRALRHQAATRAASSGPGAVVTHEPARCPETCQMPNLCYFSFTTVKVSTQYCKIWNYYNPSFGDQSLIGSEEF